MKVSLINAQFDTDSPSGARNYVYRTAKTLERRGHEASIITTEPYDGRESLTPTRTNEDGLDVWRFYPANIAHRGEGTGRNVVEKALWHGIDAVSPHSRRVVGDLLDRLRPDVVHTNNLVGIAPALAGAIRDRDVRHVHTLHDYSLICPRSNLLRDLTAPEGERTVCEDPPTPCRLLARAKRRGLGTPDVVTGPSQHVVDVHHEHGFFEDARCERLQLGVTSVVESPPPIPEDPSLLFVGQHLESKGLETLLDAAERLPAVEVDICGTGPYADVTERRASELDNVRYHGFVSDEELARLRRDSTAAVVPSIWMENSPLTIYESFAAGLPVVGSDIGGIPELVADGERGYTFEPKSVGALVTAVQKVLGHERGMRENAVSWARERTFDVHVDRLEELYG
jgi:glycosyltransferase involved in cell wall biosynthesis